MTALEGEWRLIREEELDAATAMAYDAVAAETAAAGGPRTVRLYRWTPSALSLGYGQDPATVDWDHCADAGIDVVRRPTGGGAIYHDSFGDVSYSIVAPADELPGDVMETYALLCEPLLAALRELGVDARFAETGRPAAYEPACYLRALHPAHDVVAGSAGSDAVGGDAGDGDGTDDEDETTGPTPGRKISGNAQYRTRDAVVQHGSLTVAVDAERHLRPFADPDASPDTFRDRVTGVAEQLGVEATPALRERVVSTLEAALADWADAEPGDWSAAERERVREIADEKFRSDAWTRHAEAPARL
jgi:lipoate-protein ligase A